MRRTALPLILLAVLLAASALAQNVQDAVAFESVDGDPVARDGFASGDVAVVRVDLHNGGDAALPLARSGGAGACWSSRRLTSARAKTIIAVYPPMAERLLLVERAP